MPGYRLELDNFELLMLVIKPVQRFLSRDGYKRVLTSLVLRQHFD